MVCTGVNNLSLAFWSARTYDDLGPFFYDGWIALLEKREVKRSLLLIIAGASVQFSYPLLWIAAPLVLTRLTGKLLGSMAVAHMLGVPPGLLGAVLLPQGVLGIALALNVQQVLGTGNTILMSAVTLATAASELLLPIVAPREAAR